MYLIDTKLNLFIPKHKKIPGHASPNTGGDTLLHPQSGAAADLYCQSDIHLYRRPTVSLVLLRLFPNSIGYIAYCCLKLLEIDKSRCGKFGTNRPVAVLHEVQYFSPEIFNKQNVAVIFTSKLCATFGNVQAACGSTPWP